MNDWLLITAVRYVTGLFRRKKPRFRYIPELDAYQVPDALDDQRGKRLGYTVPTSPALQLKLSTERPFRQPWFCPTAPTNTYPETFSFGELTPEVLARLDAMKEGQQVDRFAAAPERSGIWREAPRTERS